MLFLVPKNKNKTKLGRPLSDWLTHSSCNVSVTDSDLCWFLEHVIYLTHCSSGVVLSRTKFWNPAPAGFVVINPAKSGRIWKTEIRYIPNNQLEQCWVFLSENWLGHRWVCYSCRLRGPKSVHSGNWLPLLALRHLASLPVSTPLRTVNRCWSCSCKRRHVNVETFDCCCW